MRVTIIIEDQFVSVDGEGYHGVDLSFIPSGVHALQWYGAHGALEYTDELGVAVETVDLTTLDGYALAIERWQQRKEEVEAEKTAKEEAEARALAEAEAAKQAELAAELAETEAHRLAQEAAAESEAPVVDPDT